MRGRVAMKQGVALFCKEFRTSCSTARECISHQAAAEEEWGGLCVVVLGGRAEFVDSGVVRDAGCRVREWNWSRNHHLMTMSSCTS